MDRVFSFLLWPKREARGPWKQGRKKRGSITCRTDRANEANKMFIIWLCWLFRFWKGDRELEVRTATYGPGIDQSQHTKSVSHIIRENISALPPAQELLGTALWFGYAACSSSLSQTVVIFLMISFACRRFENGLSSYFQTVSPVAQNPWGAPLTLRCTYARSK